MHGRSQGGRAVGKSLVITEKPSVAQDIVRVLGGFEEHDGYSESDDYVVTFAVGHLFELLETEELDEKYKAWTLEVLPILPNEDGFQIKPKKGQSERIRVEESDGALCVRRYARAYSQGTASQQDPRPWVFDALGGRGHPLTGTATMEEGTRECSCKEFGVFWWRTGWPGTPVVTRGCSDLARRGCGFRPSSAACCWCRRWRPPPTSRP